jgi:hypothetical protein
VLRPSCASPLPISTAVVGCLSPNPCSGRLGRGFHLEFFRSSGFGGGLGPLYLSEEGTLSGAGRRFEFDSGRVWRVDDPSDGSGCASGGGDCLLAASDGPVEGCV